MKKWIAVLAMLALLLAGCAREEKYVVNTAEQTISDGTNTYEYTDTTEGDIRTIIIRYPDGGKYTWTQSSHDDRGHMDSGKGISTTVNGYAMVQAILHPQIEEEPEQPEPRWALIVIGGIVAVLGFLQALCPAMVWNILLRRRFQKDPSDYALSKITHNGIRMIVFGFSIILAAIYVSVIQ